MFHRTASQFCRAKIRANQKDILAAATKHSRRFAVETLEQRLFLSASGPSVQTLAGPVQVAGNSWTYELEVNGETGEETFTSKGAATSPSGQKGIEVDTATTDGSSSYMQQSYYGFLPQGFVTYEIKTTTNTLAGSDNVFSSPFHLLLPATLTPGVPFTTPAASFTDTLTTLGGATSTSTGTKSDVITLPTATPSVSVTTEAGTFLCYQFNSTETNTPSGGAPTADLTETFVSPTVGVVEIDDVTNDIVATLTNFTGTSNHLAVTQQPTNTLAGNPINPAVQVALQDSSGTTDTNAADAVTITASIAPGGTGTGTLSGTASVATVNGVANFSNLSINKPGKYTLNFTDTAGDTVASAPFQISAGKLIFRKQPTDAVAGNALSPAVEVELVDSKGNKITDAPSLVTLNISGNNSGNPITGNTAQLVNGTAVFDSIKLAVPGSYVLSATDDQGDVSAQSNQFEIAGPFLVFTKEPGKTGVDAPLRYILALEVEESNHHDKILTDRSDAISFSLNTLAGGSNSALSSNGDMLDRGIADNADTKNSVSINSPGTYTITAAVVDGGADIEAIAPVTSTPFVIAADQLAFKKQPANASVKAPLRYEVALEDYKGHTVTGGTDGLKFTLNTISGGTGAVLASSTDTLSGGIADDSGTIPLSINSPGTYSLTVVDVPANPADPAAKTVTSKVFKITMPKS